MTGMDIRERGESWPLTGGGSRAEVFEDQSEESRHRVWPPDAGWPQGRAVRFLTVVPFYFSWEKLHTIRNYRGLLLLVSTVATATQTNRWRQVSSFTVFCRQKGRQILGMKDHYHKTGFLVYCLLLCYWGSCFHKYIMNHANRHGHCKWLWTTNRNCRTNLKSGINFFASRSGFGRHSHFPVIKGKPHSSSSHIWFGRSAVLGCQTSPSPLPTPHFLSPFLLSPFSSPRLIPPPPPPPDSAVIASVCHLYNLMNVFSSVLNSVLMDGLISKALHTLFLRFTLSVCMFSILLRRTTGQTLTGIRICVCVCSGGRGVLWWVELPVIDFICVPPGPHLNSVGRLTWSEVFAHISQVAFEIYLNYLTCCIHPAMMALKP